MSKIIRLTESDLTRIVKRVINEQLANAKVANKPSSEIPNFMTMPNGVELVQRALLKK
jgi:hypothetical protein